MNDIDFPMHDKLSAVADTSQAIHDFLEWAGEEYGAQLMVSVPRGADVPWGDAWVPAPGLQRLLADFFGISLNVLEAEKRAMLVAIRQKSEDKG